MKTPAILVVDDDLPMRRLIGEILEEEGMNPVLAQDGIEANKLLKEQPPDLVITDLMMPHISGIGILRRAKEANPDVVVIVITGYGTIESAIESMKKGAWDYIQKPFEPDEFLLLIKRALGHITLLRENRRLVSEVESCRYGDIIGTSRGMTDLKKLVEKIAPFDTSVLLQGETGTGKELISRLIHKRSKRSAENFLPLNCGALSESLLEAELFGYEKGAFTGACRQKAGLFEAAHRGTILLDEINATSPNFQVKLLRVLQEGSFIRVGGTNPVLVDVRVIAASNVSIETEIEAGRFRQDLLYRLNVVTVEIPPLRKRKEDIPSLAYYFLNKYSTKYQKSIKGITNAVLEQLVDYSWPGNVRELENVIERAVIMETGPEVGLIHLPKESKKEIRYEDLDSGIVGLEDMEKTLIQRTLKNLHGQKAKAAVVLGISTTSLWRKMKKYQME
jgi:DNA-binding NtrC family response regulator